MKQKRQQIGEHSPEMDWAERLRDHLADYEAPVPDDLSEVLRLPDRFFLLPAPIHAYLAAYLILFPICSFVT